jgi:hypothetical protein
MYFDPYPKISYVFDIAGKRELRVIKDIVLNVRFRQKILDNIALFDDYLIQDGLSPELISEYLYGNPNFHWTIMLVNDKFDRYEDFPMSDDNLGKYVIKKYRTSPAQLDEDILYAPKILYGQMLFRGDFDGLDCDENTPFSHMVTNVEYETTENEKKRKIRVINPQIIVQVADKITSMFDQFNGNN